MTDRDALLAGIRAAPDDDLPRLVYADYLEEHGDADRAEFIRLQCGHFCRHAVPTLVRGDAAAERMFDLEARHGRRWRAELPYTGGADWAGFRRGFPGVELLSRWRRRAETIWAAAPVELVVIHSRAAVAAEFAASPYLARVRALVLRGSVNEPFDALPALVANPAVEGLRALDANGIGVDDDGAELLAGCRHLAGLEVLRLGHSRVGERGALALARSPHLAAGLRVSLIGCPVTDPDVWAELAARFPEVAKRDKTPPPSHEWHS